MKNTIALIYDSIDIIVALALGIWLVATKGKLTSKDKPIHKFPTKWLYICGCIGILYAVLRTVELFF